MEARVLSFVDLYSKERYFLINKLPGSPSRVILRTVLMSSQSYDPNRGGEKGHNQPSHGTGRGVANRSVAQLYSKRKRQASGTLNSNRADDRNAGKPEEQNQGINSARKGADISMKKQNERLNSRKTLEVNAVESNLRFKDFGGCEDQLLVR